MTIPTADLLHELAVRTRLQLVGLHPITAEDLSLSTEDVTGPMTDPMQVLGDEMELVSLLTEIEHAIERERQNGDETTTQSL